jgi:hypothetical protein
VVCAVTDESSEDREPIHGHSPVRPTVDVRLDWSILRSARRIGSHYAIITVGMVSMFDAADKQVWMRWCCSLRRVCTRDAPPPPAGFSID